MEVPADETIRREVPGKLFGKCAVDYIGFGALLQLENPIPVPAKSLGGFGMDGTVTEKKRLGLL